MEDGLVGFVDWREGATASDFVEEEPPAIRFNRSTSALA